MENIKERITSAITGILDHDYGFEVFVMMKNKEQKKIMIFDEGDPQANAENIKNRIGDKIAKSINEKFLQENTEYIQGDNIADNQEKMYVIPINDEYNPFDVINLPEDEDDTFSIQDKDDALGFLFCYTINGNQRLWAYQHFRQATIINKKEKNLIMKIFSSDIGDVFQEITDILFTITDNVELLIVSSREEDNSDITEIVTDNIRLMEQTFSLEKFIRNEANQAIKSLRDYGIIENIEKMEDYLQRSNANKRYARKVMRIRNSKVFDMKANELRNKVESLARWKDKIKFNENGKIELKSYKVVENLIDLFDERFTRSDVTGQEYDTSVKNPASAVGNTEQ